MITVDDKEMQWKEGMVVRDILNQLDNTDFCAAVRLNGKLVSTPFFDSTLVLEGALIYLLPLIAGG